MKANDLYALREFGLFLLGAVGCFIVCWGTSILIGLIGLGKLGEKLGGAAIGAGAIALAKEWESPGLLYGSVLGYVAYFVSILILVAVG